MLGFLYTRKKVIQSVFVFLAVLLLSEGLATSPVIVSLSHAGYF